MATSDLSEWILLDTDLTTRLAILPALQSHLYFEMNEPGSGEVKIPLDSAAAALVTDSMYCQLSYRGAVRGGFLVENIKEFQADASDGGGRKMSLSGRGGLAILEEAIVWDTGGTETTRKFTTVTKASALITLITEAQARGALANLAYDFDAVNDSNTVAWTDSDNYSFAFQTTLLDVVRLFVKTGGFNVSINISGGNIVLSAYLANIGTDKTSSVFMRVGTNCEEFSEDARGNEVRNVIRVNYKEGFTTSSDSTSITNRRRREKFVQASDLPTPTLSAVVGDAEISQYKDPQTSITVKVYDGVKPYLFEDYVNGDTVALDSFGVVTDYRILGIQADFDGADFSHVVLETNTIFRERDIQTQQQLDKLAALLEEQKDAATIGINQWFGIGKVGDFEVGGFGISAIELDATNKILYLGGSFTTLLGVATSRIASYNLVTRIITPIAGIANGAVYVMKLISGILYVGGSFTGTGGGIVASWTVASKTWNTLGTGSGGTNNFIATMAYDGSDIIYMGGDFTDFRGDAAMDNAMQYSISGNAFTNIGETKKCYAMVYESGILYAGGGGFWNKGGSYGISKYTIATNTWGAVTISGFGNGTIVYAIKYHDDHLYIGGDFTGYIKQYKVSTSTEVTISTLSARVRCFEVDGVNNLYIGGEFTNGHNFATADYIVVYNTISGEWQSIAGGFNSTVRAIKYDTNSGDIYAGGVFTTVNDATANKMLAVYIKTLQNAIDFAASSSGSSHAPVTLDVNAETLLSLSAQELGLDTQTANRVLAGATSGGAAVPTFRALVAADIPALSYGDISGTGVAGQVAEFVTNTKTIQAAKIVGPAVNILTLTNAAAATLALNITAAKTLTLTSADNYTLTIPATGVVGLLGTAQTWTAANKINVNSTTALFVEQDGVNDNTFIIDTTNGRVGVGIAPLYSLHVSSTLTNLSGSIYSGYLDSTFLPASTSPANAYAIQFQMTANSTNGNLTGGQFGSRYSIFTTGGNTFARVEGFNAVVDVLAGSGAITTIRGASVNVIHRTTAAAISSASAFEAAFTSTVTTGGATTFYYAFLAKSPTASAGKLGTAYGLFVESVTAGGTNFAIRTALGNNRFGDQVYILGAVDKQQLIVQGFTTQTLPPAYMLDNTATTNAVRNVLQLETRSTGTPANGLGAGLLYSLETATSDTIQNAGVISASWVDATNATRKAKLSLSAYDTAARLGMEISADGSQSMVAIGGATASARLTLPAGGTAVNTAPLKFTTQASPLTAVEQGTMELVGNSLQFTQLAKRCGVTMSQSVRTSSTTVENTVTESAALVTAEHGANYLEVGKMEEIVLSGTIEQRSNPSATLTFTIKYAGSTIHTVATTANNLIATGSPFILRLFCTVRTIGATGTMQINSWLEVPGETTKGGNSLATIDTTSAQNTTITATWGEANAANILVVQQARVLCIETNK